MICLDFDFGLTVVVVVVVLGGADEIGPGARNAGKGMGVGGSILGVGLALALLAVTSVSGSLIPAFLAAFLIVVARNAVLYCKENERLNKMIEKSR